MKMRERFANWLLEAWIWLVWIVFTMATTGCAVDDLHLGYASQGDCRLDDDSCELMIDTHFTRNERIEIEAAVVAWEDAIADAGYDVTIEMSYCRLHSLELVEDGLSKGWDSPTRVDQDYVPPNVGGIVLYTREINRTDGDYLDRFRAVATHEIGHWLGADHSPDPLSVMHPEAHHDFVTVSDVASVLAAQN